MVSVNIMYWESYFDSWCFLRTCPSAILGLSELGIRMHKGCSTILFSLLFCFVFVSMGETISLDTHLTFKELADGAGSFYYCHTYTLYLFIYLFVFMPQIFTFFLKEYQGYNVTQRVIHLSSE